MAVTAIVRFALPEGKTRAAAKAAFEASAPLYRSVPGLIRKYYLLSEDSRTGGGVYLFDSREDGERLYDAAWRAGIQERLGARAFDRVLRIPGDRRQRRRRDLHGCLIVAATAAAPRGGTGVISDRRRSERGAVPWMRQNSM